ncbi:MAG: TonB-dependent receptor [Bacteroides sp.]|nr:TonB-dependent receptor [Bacteroides sp.]
MTATFRNVTLNDVIWELQKQTDFTFIYSTADVQKVKVNEVNAVRAEVTEILDKCLENSGLTYTIYNGVVAIKKTQNTAVAIVAPQQRVAINGQIVDITGDPLPGVNVVVKGTQTGAISDMNGNFSVTIEGTTATLLFSFIGYASQEVVATAGKSIKVIMKDDTELLDEVVVVAYGQQRKEAITGAVANIKSDLIERRPISSAVAALEGQALGVQVNNSYGEPGKDPEIRIRGFNSINGDNKPLYVLNGVPMSGNMSDINPSDIESITVLKDAASAALYGNKAAAGVVLITTKSGKVGEENLEIQATINQGIYQRGMKEYERLNAYDFMEAYWQAHRNSLYTVDQEKNTGKYATWTDANKDVLENVRSKIGEDYNIFNKSWEELFDANGKLAPGTQIEKGYLDDLDWYEPMIRNGSRGDYNINARGGSKKASYYLGLGYLTEEGFMKKASSDRFSGNARIDVKPTEWLKLGGTLNASYQEFDFMKGDPTDNGTSIINPFNYARNMAPIYPIHVHATEDIGNYKKGDYILDELGNKIFDRGSDRSQYQNRHIVWETELDQNKKYRSTIDMTAYANITFLKDFVLTITGNLNNRNTSEKTYNSAVIGDGEGAGRMKQTDYRYKDYMFQQLLNWNRSFNEVHNVEALVGHENYYYNRQYTYLYKTNEKFPGLMELSNFSTFSSTNGYQSGYRTEGYFTRLGYNYNDKYFVDASFRRDGSSRFYTDKRWGNFWSIGGSWIISNEEFMRNVSWINNLKLRAAYGEVGKESSVDYYAWMALYTSTQNGGEGAFYRRQFEAKDITWEKVKSLSIALESRLFNRVNFSIEYFDKTSDDLLFDLTLPLSIGSKPDIPRPIQTVNFGSIANRGFEIGLDVDIVKTRDWKLNMGTNLNFMKNKVVKLPKEYGETGYVSGNRRYLVGHSRYAWWLYQYEGVDKSNGRSVYEFNDTDYYIKNDNYSGSAAMVGDDKRTEATETMDYTIIDGVAYSYTATYAKKDWSGSAIPKLYGSFTTAVTYKDFQLSALFTFQTGGKVLDSPYRSLMAVSETPGALHKDVLNSWTPEDAGIGIDKNATPALNTNHSGSSNMTSSRFLKSSDYFMIKNVTLSYNIPRTFLDKFNIKGLMLSASTENLGIFTKRRGMNVQQAWSGSITNGYPPARVFSFGLNLKF